MPNYPTKALQEYVLKSDYIAGGGGGTGGGTGPAGPAGPPGATGPAGAPGAPWTPVQSATAPAVVSTGTIATAGLTVSRVAPTNDCTNVILQSGTIAGQQVCVLNESGFSITFATAVTSHVSIGNSCTISGNLHLQFLWNTVTGYWYPAGVIGAVIPPGSGTFGTGTFGANTFGG